MSTANLKVGINGFGRIGRAVTRQILQGNKHSITHINDLNPDTENLAYLLKYDTTYGSISHPIHVHDKNLVFGDQVVRVTAEKDVAKVPWGESEVDIIVESTGVKQNELSAKALTEKGLHVLVTHMVEDPDFTLVFGVNEKEFDSRKHKLISTSICDANACAPVLKALNDQVGLAHGFITTIHPWLSYQNLMDGPSRSQSYPGMTHSHYVLGRSSMGTLIPKPTTVVSACEKVLPDIQGKLKCFSYRVPTSIVSSADLTLELGRTVSEDEICSILSAHQEQVAGGIKVIRQCNEPLISVDYLKAEHSAVVDTRWVMLNEGRHLKMVLWYDNEWGYSNRVVDSLELIAQTK